MNKFKKPDLKAPRFRHKRLSLLNKNTFDLFKEEKPVYADVDNEKLRKIVRIFNERLYTAAIDNRDGIELPESLGFIFIGTCPPAKSVNPDFASSNEYGKVLKNKNWDTDGNIGKIFYTNWSAKYRFKNRNLWSFKACRTFKRAVAKSYPKNWTKYIKVKNRFRVSQMYLKSKS
jgi:hypothetical protein